MINGFLIKKLDMTQKYNQQGDLIPVTCCQADSCVVVDIKNTNDDHRVQLGAGEKKKPKKPLAGIVKKSKLKHAPEIIREFSWLGKKKPKRGLKIKVTDVLSPETKVNIIGTTKGRGFTGVVKRWNFRTQPRTHGQKQHWRSPGSIGPQTPGRVIKGKKMPGHYGNQRVTIKNLEIFSIDEKNNQLLIKGAVPGPKGGWLQIVKNG